MRKNLMRVLALTMLFVMLAAGAYAAPVYIQELENAINNAEDGATIQIVAVDPGYTESTITITKPVNVTIEWLGSRENNNYGGLSFWSNPIFEFKGAGSNVTFKNIDITSTNGDSPCFAVLSGGDSTLTIDSCNIDFTYDGSIAKFNSNNNTLIITDRNYISVNTLGDYISGTSYNIVKLPCVISSSYDYTVSANDKIVRTDWENETSGTAFAHSELTFTPSTSTCVEIGKMAYYSCVDCGRDYSDEQGLQLLYSIEDDNDFNPNNHEEIVSVPANMDVCGNGIAAHYECVDCEAIFYDAEGKEPAAYGDLMTVGTNHSPTIKYSVGPATCTMAEIYKEFYQCDRMECGILLALVNGAQVSIMENMDEYYDVDWNLVPHQMTTVPYKAPTATEDGNYEYYICSSCEGWYYWDEEEQDYYEYYDKTDVIIPAGTSDHEHVRLWVEATSATATAHGYQGHYECETCGKWFDDWAMTEEITDKNTLLEHKNGYRFAEEKASCEERVPRVDHIVCEVSGCGRFFTDYTYAVELTEDEALWPIGDHVPNKEDYVAPTETEEGSKEFYWCDECFRMFWDEACTKEFFDEDEIIIPVVSHTHDNPATSVPEVPATETSTGVAAHYKCEGCGKLFKDAACTTETTLEELTLQMLEHTHKPVHHERVEAAVGQDGTIEYYSCEGCDKLFADEACTQEITETDIVLHVHGNGTHVPQKDATYTEEGNIEHYVCSCGKLFGEEACVNELTSVSIPKAVEIKGESAEVDADAIINHAESASASGSGAITVPLSESTPVESVETTADALIAVKDEELAIEFEMGKVTDSQGAEKTVSVALDNVALTAALKNAEETDQVVLTVEQNDESVLDSKQMNAAKEAGKVALVISASLKIGDADIHDFEGGYAELRIPFEIQPGKNAADYVLYYLAEDGTAEKIEDAKFENGYIIVKVGHFSDFAVIDTNPTVSAADAAAEELPQTGDNSQLFLWMSLLMISLCAFAVSRKVRA